MEQKVLELMSSKFDATGDRNHSTNSSPKKSVAGAKVESQLIKYNGRRINIQAYLFIMTF